MAKELWVDFRHPSYEETRYRRTFARDQYTGNALHVAMKEAEEGAKMTRSTRLDIGRTAKTADGEHFGQRLYDSLRAGTLGTYLRKRAQGEADAAFRERASITRFPSHMSALIDSYIGGVFAVESKATRNYGPPLGDPAKPSSTMFSLHRDIDGSGRNWHSAIVSSAADLIIDDVVWYYAERPDDSTPVRIYTIDPDRVLNWRERDGLVIEVLIQEDRWENDSLFDEADLVTYYIRYTLDGWERYREVGEGEKRDVELVGQGNWRFPFYTDATMARRRLPIGRVRLPIGRSVGYQMAEDHNALYNLLSDARWNFRVMNHPRLRGLVDDDAFIAAMEKLQMGFNALQGDWAYISPDAENAAAAYRMYADEVRQFYITNHQRMNTPNIERSATEIVYNEAAGRTAFLTLLVGAVDEIENDWLFLASQIEAPSKPETWSNSRVVRSRDFKPVDIEHLAMTQSNSFAALIGTLPAELAAAVAREGLTDENIAKMRDVGMDPEVEEDF